MNVGNLSELETSDGRASGILFGALKSIRSVLDRFETKEGDTAVLVWDGTSRSKRRLAIYPDYKANRDPAPEELKRQFKWAREIAESLGLQCFADPRYEADDLIGTLSEYWRARGHPVCVVSSDKDLVQLVREGDFWWDFARNQKLGHGKVSEKFGVRPEQMADFLALTGDSVDNIPGIPGVGAKTAAALLGHFEDLASLRARLAEVQHLSIRGAKSLSQKLLDNWEAAELALQLTRIHTAVPSALEQPDITRGAIDQARLNRLFDELSFGGMLRQRCLQTGA